MILTTAPQKLEGVVRLRAQKTLIREDNHLSQFLRFGPGFVFTNTVQSSSTKLAYLETEMPKDIDSNSFCFQNMSFYGLSRNQIQKISKF